MHLHLTIHRGRLPSKVRMFMGLIKKLCITSSSPITPTIQTAAYCDQFALMASECAGSYPCAWYGSQCTYFTGCTVYTYDTNEKCSAISTRCITDGVHCVEKDTCSSYKAQKACVINKDGKYCYWNNSDTIKYICEDIDDCLKIPLTINTDTLCRQQLSKCTASATGGCIESGINCSDQLAEIGCVQNKDKSQNCFWKEGKCWDKTCDNASSSLVTDQSCKDFLSTCTTKENGGCVKRAQCEDAKIQAACYTDQYGKDCFWNGQSCVNKICTNALQTNKTNLSCQQYLSNCITNGSGCVENTGCEAARIEIACDQTLTGQKCHWDGTYCKIKNCQNAGPNYVGHDQCTAYMSTCTANGASGCIDRNCNNAPLTITSNDDCKAYFPSGNCIAKLNGGCRDNTTCEAIDNNNACTKDQNGNACFWIDNQCKAKICSNAPSDKNTHELCQSFLSSCTIGSNGTCVDNTCENVQSLDNCTYDFNQKPCIYKGKCFKKLCAYASQSITSHEGCQAYLSSCTLSNQGTGCMDIPQKCEQITNNKSCKIKADGKKCGVLGNKCVDSTCLTAPIDGSYDTTLKCDQYKSGCVVNNNLNGCIDLPNTCAERTNQQNCGVEQTRGSTANCEWDDQTNSSNPVCIDVKCENAHLVSLKGNVTQEGCWDYASLNCVITTNGDISTCMVRPKICNGLIENACKQSKVLQGDKDCFWDSGSLSCKDVACSSITFSSGTIDHTACNGKINSCTVNDNKTGCMDFKPQCTQYTLQDQCKFDSNGIACKYTANGCIDKPCTDADSTHNTNELCQQFSKKCFSSITKKCDLKKSTCAEIKDENSCNYGTINFVQCKWNETNEVCENSQFQCSLIQGIGFVAEYCQLIGNTCTVNLDGTSCITASNKCTDYGTNQQNCVWSLLEGYCKYISGSCVVDCLQALGPYDYDYCQSYNTLCAVKLDLSGCVNVVSDCASTDKANCTKSLASPCYLSGVECISTPIIQGKCDSVTGVNLTPNYCQQISTGGNTCSVNPALTQCVEKSDDCFGYSQDVCYYSINDKYCATYQFGTMKMCLRKTQISCFLRQGDTVDICKQQLSFCTHIEDRQNCAPDCESVTGPIFDFPYCQSFDNGCSAKLDGTGCSIAGATCADIKIPNDCTLSYELMFCYLIGNTCTAAKDTPLTSANCETITGTRLTATYCKGISNKACSVSPFQTKCVVIASECSGYNGKLENCFASLNDLCVVNSTDDKCYQFNPSVRKCTDIRFHGFTNNYTDYQCKYYKSTCKANADGTACTDINHTCSSFQGTNLTFFYCINKMATCSVNAAKTECIDAKKTCAEYSSSDCGYALNEGVCVLINNSCVQKSCNDAPHTNLDMNVCQNYSPNCILQAGSCETKGSCPSYLNQGACWKNLNNEDCLWNQQSAVCVDKSCQNAEASTYFNSNDECETAGNCTVKASNGNIGMGCIQKTSCNNYTIQEQCKTNNAGIKCIWNTNLVTPVCADKSCSTAPVLNYKDHNSCNEYLSGCTVNIVQTNGTLTSNGCIPYKKCDEYVQVQCFLSSEKNINGQNIECAWNGIKCGNKSCLTATSDVNSPSFCSNYYLGCTVNQTNDGCIEIPESCETMTEQQCFTDSVDRGNRQCIWIQSDQKCITKKCEDSPNYGSESECEAYLPGCTIEQNKCKTMICEDYQFKTDSLCKLALPNNVCTTNGSYCVTRTSCDQVLGEAGCVSDNNGNLCQWITPTNYSAQCIIRTCSTAPNTLKTELQCKQYFTPQIGQCTTKKDGGCILKGSCNTITAYDACNIDSNNIECAWDNDKSTCRVKECKDFYGNTITECKKIRPNCTIGLNGKCATIKNCEDTHLQASCIEGLNGPCLWIDKYENTDGTKGACFKYDSCKSLNWTNDNNCKWISSNCTTDGTQCIGITNCAETNINGGCVTGTDGSCIQTISTKGTIETVCKQYSSCKVAYYLTHEQCNNANPQCTSDYTNGCIPLDSCSTYTLQKQCLINKQGVIRDQNGFITSTGKCAWDSNTNKCNDQQCTDILLSTQQDCSNAMKTCTTDGTTCIVKGACNSYKTQNACNYALGTEGPCFWVMQSVSSAAVCRSKTCSDLANGTINEVCSSVSNCVSDGINCVSKAKCSAYITQTECMGSGIDGLCAWVSAIAPATQGSCILMTGCSVAKDELACNQAQNRCNWNSITNLCVEHTCEPNYNQQKICQYYSTWDLTKYNICSFTDGKCKSTDEKTLNKQECYFQTGYQYSWSPSINKCSLCNANSLVNNTNNNSNNHSVEHGTIISLMSIILLSLII